MSKFMQSFCELQIFRRNHWGCGGEGEEAEEGKQGDCGGEGRCDVPVAHHAKY